MSQLLIPMVAAVISAVDVAPTAENWTISNFENRLVCEAGRCFRGGVCLYVGGPTGKCVNAFRFDSRRVEVPEGAKSCEISFEAYSEKWLNGLYQDKWDAQNAVMWYDAEGKGMERKFRFYLPRGDFSKVTVRMDVPGNMRQTGIRIAREIPCMGVGEDFAVRNVRFSFSDGKVVGKNYEVMTVPMKVGPVSARQVDVSNPTPVQSIRLRKDGMAIVDGKPFFPIGMFGTVKHEVNGMSLDNAFAELKENGFNLTYAWKQKIMYQEYVDAAERSGMKLFTLTRPPDTQMLESGRFSSAILAWYVGDDTGDFMTPEELTENVATLKRVDPYRLTTQADGVGDLDLVDRSRYADYVNATDVFMPEIYLTYDQSGVDLLKPGMSEDEWNARCVAEVIRQMDRIHADVGEFGDGSPRACWPILQCFNGWCGTRYPTDAELRGMAFAAIVHGANGLSWYTYTGFNKFQNVGVTSNPAKWSFLKGLAREISGYSDVLLQNNRENPPAEILSGPAVDAFGAPSVTSLLKRKGNEAWLFAVNAVKANVNVRFRLKHTDRNIIEDEFDPFGVRIYRLKINE